MSWVDYSASLDAKYCHSGTVLTRALILGTAQRNPGLVLGRARLTPAATVPGGEA